MSETNPAETPAETGDKQRIRCMRCGHEYEVPRQTINFVNPQCPACHALFAAALLDDKINGA